jgi:hypothetical protein
VKAQWTANLVKQDPSYVRDSLNTIPNTRVMFSDNCTGLRLLAPSNLALRTCLKDCILPYGGGPDGLPTIYIAAGTHIDLDFSQMHKDKDIWGEDALEFRPERWENLDLKFKYQPFFAGTRKCPTQQMLISAVRLIIGRDGQAFRED